MSKVRVDKLVPGNSVKHSHGVDDFLADVDSKYALQSGSLSNINNHSHTVLTNIGTNTHADIDTALTRLVNTSGINTGDQDLSGKVNKSGDTMSGSLTVQNVGYFKAPGEGRMLSVYAYADYEVGYIQYVSATGQTQWVGSPYGATVIASQNNHSIILNPGTNKVSMQVNNSAVNSTTQVCESAASLTQTTNANFNNYCLIADMAVQLNNGITNTGTTFGFIGGVNINAGHAGNLSKVVGLAPINTLISGAAGSIEEMVGLRARAVTYTGPVTTAIGTAIGFRIEVSDPGGGSIGDNYGLYIDGVTKGSTTNYAIYTNTGVVRFGDVVNTTENYQVDGVQVVGNRVVDARIDDVINSGDTTTDGVIDAIRDALIAHGLIAAS